MFRCIAYFTTRANFILNDVLQFIWIYYTILNMTLSNVSALYEWKKNSIIRDPLNPVTFNFLVKYEVDYLYLPLTSIRLAIERHISIL